MQALTTDAAAQAVGETRAVCMTTQKQRSRSHSCRFRGALRLRAGGWRPKAHRCRRSLGRGSGGTPRLAAPRRPSGRRVADLRHLLHNWKGCLLPGHRDWSQILACQREPRGWGLPAADGGSMAAGAAGGAAAEVAARGGGGRCLVGLSVRSAEGGQAAGLDEAAPPLTMRNKVSSHPPAASDSSRR